MKILITYMSLTGNTEKIAEAIYEEIREGKEIIEFSEVTSLKDYNLIFLGFPMHGFAAPEDMEKFMNKNCRGKMIALFITHGAPDDSPELPPWLEKCKEAAVGAEVVGMFNCQGELAQDVIDALLASDNLRHREYGKHGDTTIGQPDESRLERARQFARDMVDKLSETHPIN